MARGQPEGEQGYTPEVSAEDLPRKMVPEIRELPIAGALQHAGNEISSTIDNKYRADSVTYAGEQLSKFTADQTNKLDAAKSAVPAGQDPGDFAGKYMAQYQKDSGALLEQASANPIARAILQKSIMEMGDRLFQHTKEWESGQRVAYRQDNFQNYVKTQSDALQAHPELLDTFGSAGSDMANAIGGDPKQRLILMRQMHEQFSASASQGLARQDPVGTLHALNNPENAPAGFSALEGLTEGQREAIRAKANEHLTEPIYASLEKDDTRSATAYLNRTRDIMDPKTSWEMSRRIDAQVKEKENEQKQDIADRYQDSLKAAEFGLKNPVNVTQSELGVLYKHDAQRHWDILQSAAAASAATHQYDKMTPAEVIADRDKALPTEGGREAAIGIESYEVRARAADRSLRARDADSAAFAIKNGSWQPLDFNNPQSIPEALASRSNTRDQVSRQAGVATDMLSKDEASRLGGWLEAQPPGQRIGALTQLRQSVTNDKDYSLLMHQIAPQAPLTTWVGSNMSRPNGELAPSWWDSSYAKNPVIGQRVLEGEQILSGKGTDKEKGIKSSFPMPKDSELMTYFQTAAGGANTDLFRERHETQETAYEAYKALYAAQASHEGKGNGIIQPDIARDAAEAVLGHTQTYGNTTISVPQGMSPAKFDGAVSTATEQAMKAGGYSDKDIEAMRAYGLREQGDQLGSGRYWVINGTGDPLRGRDGKKIEIDLNRQYQGNQLKVPEPAEPTAGLNRRIDAK
jgi:hypothetical protein